MGFIEGIKMSEKSEHDVDALLRKNAELLGQVKILKSKLAEAQGAHEAALQVASDAQATMRKVTLEKPLEAALSPCFVAPWRVVRPLLDEFFVVEDGGADGVQIQTRVDDGEGEELALDAMLRHIQTIPDLAAMLRPASGGGASGASGGRGGVVPKSDKTEPREKVASPFGLR